MGFSLACRVMCSLLLPAFPLLVAGIAFHSHLLMGLCDSQWLASTPMQRIELGVCSTHPYSPCGAAKLSDHHHSRSLGLSL